MKLYNLFQNKKSQGLIGAIFVIVLVLGLGVSLLLHIRSQTKFIELQTTSYAAHALAKSGIEIAKSSMPSGGVGSCAGGGGSGDIAETTYVLGPGSVTIKATSGAITSVGTADQSVQVMHETVEVAPGGPPITTWAKTYGDTEKEEPSAILTTSDNGYIVGGSVFGAGGAGVWDIALLKTDADGNLSWAKLYGNTKTDRVYEAKDGMLYQIPSDNGYIIGGWGLIETKEDFLVLRTDSSGNIGPAYPNTWAYTYGGAQIDLCYFLAPTFASAGGNHNGYILAGRGNSWASNNEGVVVKIDLNGALDSSFGPGTPTGAVRYSYTDGGGTSRAMHIGTVVPLYGGGGALTGYMLGGWVAEDSNSTIRQFILVKTGTNGAPVVDGSFGTTGAKVYGVVGEDNINQEAEQTSDGGYIIGGNNGNFSLPGSDGLVVKVDSQGTIQWKAAYNNRNDVGASCADTFWLIEPTLAGDGYFLGGRSDYGAGKGGVEAFLIKSDLSGNIVWQQTYGDPAQDTEDWFLSLIEHPSNAGLTLLETFTSWGQGLYETGVVKADALGQLCCSPDISRPANFEVNFSVNVISADANVVAASVPSAQFAATPREIWTGGSKGGKIIISNATTTVSSLCSNP